MSTADLAPVVDAVAAALEELPADARLDPGTAATAAVQAALGPLVDQLRAVLADAVAVLPVGSADGASDEALRFARLEISRQIRSGALLRSQLPLSLV